MRRLVTRCMFAAVIIFGLSAATSGCPPPDGVCPTSDTPSTYAGTRYSGTRYSGTSGMTTVIQVEWDAGFHARADLVAATEIGIAESSLTSAARNWHPDFGCRPSSDYIGVQGPDSVWDSNHARQLNSDRGIWQISSHWWPQYDDHVTDDIAQAAGAVRSIEAQGGWSEWDTWDNGAAQSHSSEVTPVVNSFCQTHACT